MAKGEGGQIIMAAIKQKFVWGLGGGGPNIMKHGIEIYVHFQCTCPLLFMRTNCGSHIIIVNVDA